MDTLSELTVGEVKELELTALAPIEMVNAQQQLITWCDCKMVSVKQEVDDLDRAVDFAKLSGWKYTTLQSQHNKAEKRLAYYQKIKAALMEGYYIIPNFPIDLFAIRTTRDKPKKYLSTRAWRNDDEQATQDVPIGEGQYRNPNPIEKEKRIDEKTTQYWASDWQDEIEFPLNMAKPIIMEATGRAMALKIFDRIGIMPAERKGDPVIIGQIVNKNSQYSSSIVSFMIAWHLDTKTI